MKTKPQAERLVRGWLNPDNDSHSATLARQLASGEWLTPEWQASCMVGADINKRALLSYVVGSFRAAGYHVQMERASSHPSAKQYRIRGGLHRSARATLSDEDALEKVRSLPEVVKRSPAAVVASEYPRLGHALSVRALALTDDGVLIHLSDGDGGAWQALITGYVEGA
jgi:hypothetical protein